MKYNPFYTILIGLEDAGYTIETQAFFDTLKIQPKNNLSEIQERAKSKKINLRYFSDGCVSIIIVSLASSEKSEYVIRFKLDFDFLFSPNIMCFPRGFAVRIHANSN